MNKEEKILFLGRGDLREWLHKNNSQSLKNDFFFFLQELVNDYLPNTEITLRLLMMVR